MTMSEAAGTSSSRVTARTSSSRFFLKNPVKSSSSLWSGRGAGAGGAAEKPRQLREHAQLIPERARRLHAREPVDLPGDLFDVGCSQSHRHALQRAEGVDENGDILAAHVFEEQGR